MARPAGTVGAHARATTLFKNSQADVFNYREKLEQTPDNAALQYALALALSKTNEHDEALALMRKLEGKISSRIFFQASLAELLIAAEELTGAQSLLAQQLNLYPDNFPLAMMYARALVADEQYDDAEIVLETQSKLRPTDTHIWFLLAETAGSPAISQAYIWQEQSISISTGHCIGQSSTWNTLSA